MITLVGFGANFGLADPSPFVLKVDLFLKMSGIPFNTDAEFAAFRKAPKGKLPYIVDDGTVVADSCFIVSHLKNKYGDTLDQHLSPKERATAYLIGKSLDENFYWCIVYSRWLCDDTWPIVKQTFFGGLPFPLKHIVPAIGRRGIASAFVKQGMGKHSDQEIMHIAEQTLESLSVMLGDNTYFFGDKPCSLDASAFAFLSQVTISKVSNPLNQLAKKFGNLVSYCERIQQHYYPELSS